MARFKDYSYEQTKLIPICYDRQILPGTFEHTLGEVIELLDMSLFEDRYRNDVTGAPAYDPRILLKIVLYAYSNPAKPETFEKDFIWFTMFRKR